MKNKIILLSICGAFLVGCSTTQIQTASTGEAITITSVNTSMEVWSDWVKKGNASQAQIDAVHKAYDTYYSAQQTAKAALEVAIMNSNTNSTTELNTVNNSVVSAEQALVSIINQYTSK